MARDEKGASGEPAVNLDLALALPKLTPEQVAQVSPKFIRETYAAGEAIIRQGEPPERFYIVIRGKTEVRHEGLSGHTETVTWRLPGEYFGEIGLLQNRPRSATVSASAEGEVELLVLSRQDFPDMLDESRATEAHVARDMIKRLISLADFQ